MLWTEYDNNNEVPGKKEKSTLTFRTRNREFLDHIMRKEGLDILIFSEDKSNREKQRIPYLVNLYKGLAEKGLGEIAKRQNLLSDKKDKTCGESWPPTSCSCTTHKIRICWN